MQCKFCCEQMDFLSRRVNKRSNEIEEEQFLCPKCGCYVVVNHKGECTWYDQNDNPLHPTHD